MLLRRRRRDANWTDIEDVEDVETSGSGDLEYTIEGLDNGVGYDGDRDRR